MFKLIVAFTDGACDEYLCETREGAYAHLRSLKHVQAWEIIPLVDSSAQRLVRG